MIFCVVCMWTEREYIIFAGQHFIYLLCVRLSFSLSSSFPRSVSIFFHCVPLPKKKWNSHRINERKKKLRRHTESLFFIFINHVYRRKEYDFFFSFVVSSTDTVIWARQLNESEINGRQREEANSERKILTKQINGVHKF